MHFMATKILLKHFMENAAPQPRKFSHEARRLINFATRNSLTQLIKDDTRITKTSNTLIDHIYNNNMSEISDSGVISSSFSDHDAVFVIIKHNLPRKPIENFSRRNMKNADIDVLKTLLNSLNWDTYYIYQKLLFSNHSKGKTLDHITTVN